MFPVTEGCGPGCKYDHIQGNSRYPGSERVIDEPCAITGPDDADPRRAPKQGVFGFANPGEAARNVR